MATHDPNEPIDPHDPRSTNPATATDTAPHSAAATPRHRAAVVTVSDRAALGLRADTTGPRIVEALTEAGFDVDAPVVVSDDVLPVRDAVRRAHETGARLIITTGGTGLGPRDRTPEAVQPLLDLELPHVAAAITQRPGAPATAILSRAIVGVRGADTAVYSTQLYKASLIATLPGSIGGVTDGLAVILPIAHHAIAQLDGETGAHDETEAEAPHAGETTSSAQA